MDESSSRHGRITRTVVVLLPRRAEDGLVRVQEFPDCDALEQLTWTAIASRFNVRYGPVRHRLSISCRPRPWLLRGQVRFGFFCPLACFGVLRVQVGFW